MPARWQEWRADDADAPARVRGFGSPTVLVDGKDVAGAEPVLGVDSCRVYTHAGGARGAPPALLIAAALVRSTRAR